MYSLLFFPALAYYCKQRDRLNACFQFDFSFFLLWRALAHTHTLRCSTKHLIGKSNVPRRSVGLLLHRRRLWRVRRAYTCGDGGGNSINYNIAIGKMQSPIYVPPVGSVLFKWRHSLSAEVLLHTFISFVFVIYWMFNRFMFAAVGITSHRIASHPIPSLFAFHSRSSRAKCNFMTLWFFSFGFIFVLALIFCAMRTIALFSVLIFQRFDRTIDRMEMESETDGRMYV